MSKFTIEEMKGHVNEWCLKWKDQEEENKIHPSWKRLRPNKDAINYRLPGSLKK